MAGLHQPSCLAVQPIPASAGRGTSCCRSDRLVGDPGRRPLHQNRARVVRPVALFFIITGIYRLFNVQVFAGLWIAIIGWFLLEAAGATKLRFKWRTVARCAVGHQAAIARPLKAESTSDFCREFLLRTADAALFGRERPHRRNHQRCTR